MLDYLNKNKGLLLVLALSLIFLGFFYGEVFFAPNTYIFSNNGDGMKNYFTYISHIKNDASAHHFENMNYPFGELHIFTDGHTFLTWFLRLIPGSELWAIGFLNLLFLLSFPLNAIILYKLLRSYNLKDVTAISFAICIMMLAPQYDRLVGHISLSYTFFLPLVWLWTRRYYDKLHYKYSVYLFLFTVFMYFTHPYMGVISLFFTVLYHLYYTTKKHYWRHKKHILNIAIQTLIPLILFQLYVITLDYGSIRPDGKFLFGNATLDLKGIFTPHTKPFSFIFKHFLEYDVLDWESWAYIGIANTTIFFLIFYRFIFKKRRLKTIVRSPLQIIGIIALLYGTGIFFNYLFVFILDWIPAIRQIRILPRFGWIFFYTCTITCAIYFNKVFRKYYWENKKQIAIGLLLIVTGLQIFESWTYHIENGKRISQTKNPFLLDHLTEETKQEIKHLNKSTYQALLALPFFQIGGNKSVHRIKSQELFFNSLILSYHTGIPLINICLSRSKNYELDITRSILTENYTTTELLDSLRRNGKKVAVIAKEDNLNRYEKRVLDLCKDVTFSNRIFDLPYNDVMNNKQAEVLKNYSENNQLFTQSNIKYDKKDSQVIFENFDQYGNSENLSYKGGKAMKTKFNGSSLIIDLKDRLTKEKYTVNLWYYCNNDSTLNTTFVVEESHDGKPTIWTNGANTSQSFYNDGDWILSEFEIELQYPEGKHRLLFTGRSKLYDPPVCFDQILIREKGTNVFINYNDSLYKNNVFVTPLN